MIKGENKRKISKKARSRWWTKKGLLEGLVDKVLSMQQAKLVPHKEVKDDYFGKYKGNDSFQFAYANRCLREGAEEGNFNKIRDAVRIYKHQKRNPNKFLKNNISQAREKYEKRFPDERWPEMSEDLEAYIEERPLKSLGIRGPWIAIISFAIALFFLSSNITGNIIGNLSQTTSNWIGGVLFVVGLIGSFVYFKRR